MRALSKTAKQHKSFQDDNHNHVLLIEHLPKSRTQLGYADDDEKILFPAICSFYEKNSIMIDI